MERWRDGEMESWRDGEGWTKINLTDLPQGEGEKGWRKDFTLAIALVTLDRLFLKDESQKLKTLCSCNVKDMRSTFFVLFCVGFSRRTRRNSAGARLTPRASHGDICF